MGIIGRSVSEQNRAFTDLLSPELRNDYLSFVRMSIGPSVGYDRCTFEAWNTVDLTAAELVARYCDSKNLGQWQGKEFNERRRISGRRTYPLVRCRIEEEDIEAMMNNAILTKATPTPEASSEAQERFVEATRAASFSLSLGVREIRLLAARPWESTRWLKPEYTAGIQRLIEKGLLIHEVGSPPRLSEAGELVRRMLIVSRHICDAGNGATA